MTPTQFTLLPWIPTIVLIMSRCLKLVLHVSKTSITHGNLLSDFLDSELFDMVLEGLILASVRNLT